MLQGHDLIYFGPGQWTGLWRNRHHLLSRFAGHNRVLYVEPKIDLLTLRQRWRNGEWRFTHLRRELQRGRVSQAQQNLYIYHSPTFAPVSGRFPLSHLTGIWWRACLRSSLRRLNFRRPIVWLSQPEMVAQLGHWDEALTIYHVVDEYTAYQGVSAELAEWLRACERQLLGRVDMVLVVSPKLLEAKRTLNSQTYLVPNGVDVQAYRGPAHVPDDVQSIPPPRLIYAGLIGARLDLKLLADLAERRPQWSLVLVGEANSRGVEEDIARLRHLPNVHFLGLKPPGAVPDYIRACQVCLLPYRLVSETEYMDPLKLYEGLAAGKPIVATPVAALKAAGDVVTLVHTVAEAEQAVHNALSDKCEAMVEKRTALAEQNSWDIRVSRISELITKQMAVKLSKAGR